MERPLGWKRLAQTPDIPELIEARETIWEDFRFGLNRRRADYLYWTQTLGDRPKADNFLDFRYSMSLEQIIGEILSNQYQFVGVRPLIKVLFQERGDWKFMWEFVREAASGKPEDRKYLYVPVDNLFLERLAAVIPALSFNCPEQIFLYPVRPVTIRLDVEGLSVIQLKVRKTGHPFLPGFISTGRLLEFSHDNLYEYIDLTSWWGPKFETYWSPIRPLGIDFPRGVPWDGDLQQQSVAPRVLSTVAPWNGVFTGYQTTEQYGPFTYYLFERPNGSVYLDRFLDFSHKCFERFCPSEFNDTYFVDDGFCWGDNTLRRLQ